MVRSSFSSCVLTLRGEILVLAALIRIAISDSGFVVVIFFIVC
jgi:hypothetical protein